MTTSNDLIKKILDIDVDEQLVVIVLGIILCIFNYYFKENIFIITNILITTFVISLYDVYIKKVLLFSVCDNYHKLIINNVVTIVIINFLSKVIRNYSDPNLNILYYFNLIFACFFYQTIVFKLYDYNNICDKRLRTTAKTIMKLATIHILSSYLNDLDFDKDWFDFSFSQLVNFSLFNAVFVE